MKVLGFKFNKISGEKKGDKLEGIQVSTNIDIVNVKEVQSEVFRGKEQLLEVSFKYVLDYKPDYARIEFEGIVVLGIDFKLSREILKSWQDKQIPNNFKIVLFNLIIKRSGVKALQLEEDLGLPYHMPFPSLKKPQPNVEEKKE